MKDSNRHGRRISRRSLRTVLGVAGVLGLSAALLIARAPWTPGAGGLLRGLFPGTPDAAELCGDAVEWDTVWQTPSPFTGKVHAVTGHIVATEFARAVAGHPTFLNLGSDHPATPRFDLVIWQENRGAFLEAYPEGPELRLDGARVCAAGTVELHRGVPQIELRDPRQIEVTGW